MSQIILALTYLSNPNRAGWMLEGFSSVLTCLCGLLHSVLTLPSLTFFALMISNLDDLLPQINLTKPWDLSVSV